MTSETAQNIIQGLSGALKGLRLYPAQHPAIQRQFQALLGHIYQAFEGAQVLHMGLLEGSLFLEEHLFPDDQPAARDLAQLFQALELEGLEFNKRLTSSELAGFVELLHEGPKGSDFAKRLADRDIRNIRALTVRETEEVVEERTPRQIYGRALKVVDSIFRDVRLGKIPSSEEAREVVRTMAQMTINEPHALFALSMLKDYDQYTFTHSVNVSVIALAVGRACGVDETGLQTLGLGGLLHDIGKLKVEREIINKPGRLTEEEFAKIREHPRSGADIVAEMDGMTREVVDIVLGHHLRNNRRGYPADARERNISPLADMVAVADSYDAMTTLRSYQEPVTPRKAIGMLRNLAGEVLNPDYVEQFIAALGPYPVGTLLRLDSNEIGLVVWVDTQNPDDVQLKILFDAEGRNLDPPRLVDLTGPDSRRIVAEVDPFVRGIDVTDFFP